MPGRARGSRARGVGSGLSLHEPFANWDHDTSSWRTSELSLLGDSPPYSGRWPTSGMMQSGVVSARPTWAPRTEESASSLSLGWATPAAHPAGGTPEAFVARKDRAIARGVQMGNALTDLGMQAQTWATPTVDDANNVTRASGQMQSLARDTNLWATPSSRDHKDTPGMATIGVNPDGSVRDRVDQLPRQTYAWDGEMPSLSEAPTAPSDSSPQKPRRRGLNPRFGLWLMGFPEGWLDSVPSGTRSSRRARTSSDADSSP